MTASIPTTEPTVVRAGDTVKWTRSLSDYPASASWVLKYRLVNAGGEIDITASASGADHLVNVAAAVSADWDDGLFQWQAYVEKAGERYTVGVGQIEIKPNLVAVSGGLDTRSRARRILDELEAAFEDYTSNGQGMVQRYTIGGREMWFRAFDDFERKLVYWRGRVAAEEVQQSIDQGRGNPRRRYLGFTTR